MKCNSKKTKTDITCSKYYIEPTQKSWFYVIELANFSLIVNSNKIKVGVCVYVYVYYHSISLSSPEH